MADIAELIVALKLQDGVSSGLGRLNGQLKGMGAGFSQVGKGIGQVGAGIGTIATRGAIAIGALSTAVITTAASFEQSEAGIRKTVGGTIDEVDDLVDSIKQMSRTVPLSFEELAAITAEGGALGIATGNLADFTDVVARLAVSTDLTAEAAASSLGQLANVLGLEDEQLRDFGDSLVALGNDGASTESQILELTTRFGAAGKQAGLANEDILALASTTASMGIEAEAGGGALSRIFSGITLDIGTATDESKILADSMGLSLAELRTAWDRDAGGVFEDLLGYINKLDKFQAAEFLSNLGITNVRDINAISLLASGVDEYGRQLGVARGQTNELNKESDVFFNTTEGKWEVFKNNVRLAADSLGSELLPVVNEVLGDLVAHLSDPTTQKGLKDFGQSLASGIRDFIKEVKGADFGPLLDTMKGAAAIAKGAFDAFRSLPAPIQQLALAAIVANKVTGGAVGQIAGGLANILTGGLKIALSLRGSSPANPLWVQSVGGIGGDGKPGGKLPFTPPVWAGPAAAIALPLVLSGSDNPNAEMENKRLQLTKQLNEGIITAADASRLWAEAYGKTVADPFVAGARKTPPKPTVAGGGYDPNASIRDSRPDPRKTIPAVLPDTAMAPVVAGVATVNTSVAALSPILKGSDTILRTGLNANTAEVARNRAETSTRLLALSGNYAGTNARLDRSNASLSTIAAKNFSPTINLTNSIRLSPTVIQQRIVQQNVISGFTSADNSGGI